MAFDGMSFNLFEDALCTLPFSGTFTEVLESDLSDNPHTHTLWLGSVLDTRELLATSDPGVDPIVISVVDILPEWLASHAYIVGDRVQAVGGDGFVYRCTNAGTSDVAEPVWPVGGLGSTVVDNGAIWEKLSIKHEVTEIKLAITEGGLGSATAGAALTLDATILGGTDNAVPIWIQLTNDVTNVANNTTHEEIILSINEVIETAVP
jgi:hypothetical protein